MSFFALHAERECAERIPLGQFASLAAARAVIERMEEAGTWPEGYDAVAVDASDGTAWMFTSDWEPA